MNEHLYTREGTATGARALIDCRGRLPDETVVAEWHLRSNVPQPRFSGQSLATGESAENCETTAEHGDEVRRHLASATSADAAMTL